MKRRYRYALNLLSLGLLGFALYLNFIRKDSVEEMPAGTKTSEKSIPANLKKSGSLSVITSPETFIPK